MKMVWTPIDEYLTVTDSDPLYMLLHASNAFEFSFYYDFNYRFLIVSISFSFSISSTGTRWLRFNSAYQYLYVFSYHFDCRTNIWNKLVPREPKSQKWLLKILNENVLDLWTSQNYVHWIGLYVNRYTFRIISINRSV